MSYLKCISICFFGMLLMLIVGCKKETVLLETGHPVVQETVVYTQTEPESISKSDDAKSFIYVYVCGQVMSPGVYELKEGDRMYQAIEIAGGILPEGDSGWLNLAAVLTDGQKIYVPSFEETKKESKELGNILDDMGEENTGDGFIGETDLVDINHASKEVLMSLPGIGASKAEAILKYRQEHGDFESIEELMKVPGIKEGTYSGIEDRISIN